MGLPRPRLGVVQTDCCPHGVRARGAADAARSSRSVHVSPGAGVAEQAASGGDAAWPSARPLSLKSCPGAQRQG